MGPPAMFPRLSPGELHVWQVDLDAAPPVLAALAEHLSPEERRRSDRFVREADRRRYVASHAALRTILGRYLGLPPAGVEVAVRPGGKPELASLPGAPPLRFNLSHSDGLAMIAVTLDREVGVDVERVRPMPDVGAIVERYFAVPERAAWRALPDYERLAAFFRCWTRKEAYLKARGIGLSQGLDRCEVSFVPGEPALVQSSDPCSSGTPWRLYDVSPGAGEYVAACAVEWEIGTLFVHQWADLESAGGDAARGTK